MYAKLTSLDRVWGEHRALSYIQIRYPIYLPEESCINNNCNFYWYFIKDSFPHHVTTVLYQKCWSRLIFLPSSYWTEILTSGIVFLSLLFFLLMMDISRYILHFLVSKFSFSRGYLPSGLRWWACKKIKNLVRPNSSLLHRVGTIHYKHWTLNSTNTDNWKQKIRQKLASECDLNVYSRCLKFTGHQSDRYILLAFCLFLSCSFWLPVISI